MFKKDYSVNFFKSEPRDPKPKKRMNRTSDKEKERQKEYDAAKKEWFKDDPVCEFSDPKCDAPAIEPHHSKGRVGRLLCDRKYIFLLCRPHHNLVHRETGWAYANGYLVKRIDNPEKQAEAQSHA